ncbi:related to Protein EFR3 [Ustilago trichophora]|uniref:Related to Protein EFR3 n=1 Tax=Ustilago trichophora TaxID=86804 RepID=A0A5C3E9A0_9BASI|nr:related to Protein EFR3 [Ustilago trichophora]
MCLPKSNHKKLVDDCYPVPKALATSEQTRKAHQGRNLLESKAQTDAKAVKGSGPAADKGKAGLMITLAITKELLTECKSSLNYFIKPAQSIIASALDAASLTPARPRDLEISARAASAFYALASFLDPATTSVDDGFQRLLRSFATLAVERPIGADPPREKTPNSAVLLLSLITPALVENAKPNRVTLDWLRSEAKKASEGEPSYAEFNISKKPLAIRRTRSISSHVAGEKGPSSEDVISAAIGTLRGLLRHADAIQVQSVVQNVIVWLDNKSALSIPVPVQLDFAPIPFVVLDTLVDHLVENCEGKATTKHLSLIEMSRSILTGQLSLIGLSTSDTLSNLSALAVRRINDIVEEIAGRIAALQMPETASDAASVKANNLGAVNRGQQQDLSSHIHRQRLANAGPEQRDESIRVLLFALQGVLRSTHQSSGEIHEAVDLKDVSRSGSSRQVRGSDSEKGKAAASSDSKIGLAHAGTRNRVSPSSVLPTASLLVSSNHAVRLAYAQTLITLFRDEFDREQLERESAVFAATPIGEKVGDAIGLIHALGAAVHVMCLSKSLSPPGQVLANLRESPLEFGTSGASAGESAAALPVDYVAAAQALEHAVNALPCSAALALTPMLIALDKDAGSRLVVNGGAANTGLENQRRLSSRMVAARSLAKLGETFDVAALASSAQSVLAQIPSLGVEPGPSPVGGLTLPPEVVPFSLVGGINAAGESSSSSSPSIDGLGGQWSCFELQASVSHPTRRNGAQAMVRARLERQHCRRRSICRFEPIRALFAPLSVAAALAPSFLHAYQWSWRRFAGQREQCLVGLGQQAWSFEHSGPSTGVSDLREALGSASPVSARHTNGYSQDGGLSAGDLDGRRAHRRESRRGPALGNVNGSNGASAVAILDSLKVGEDEDTSRLGPDSSLSSVKSNKNAVVPPYAS